MFDAQREALALSKTPWLAMEGARNLGDGHSFDFVDLDLSNETLSVFLSKGPGLRSIAELPVTQTVNNTTWGDVLSPCRLERFLPCDAELTDAVIVSTISVTWVEVNFAAVPEAETTPNAVLPLYLELRRTDGTGPRFAGGVFYLTETNLNGDP